MNDQVTPLSPPIPRRKRKKEKEFERISSAKIEKYGNSRRKYFQGREEEIKIRVDYLRMSGRARSSLQPLRIDWRSCKRFIVDRHRGGRLVPFLVTSIPVTLRVSHVDQSQRCGKCNSLSNVRPADRQPPPLPAQRGRRCCQRRAKRRRDEFPWDNSFFLFFFNSPEMNSVGDIVSEGSCCSLALCIFVFLHGTGRERDNNSVW